MLRHLVWNISLAIKVFIGIENGTQYTNYKMNNLIKNQFCLKIRLYNNTDCTIIRLNFTKTYVTDIMRNEKRTDIQNN